jgi:hypothetical protein
MAMEIQGPWASSSTYLDLGLIDVVGLPRVRNMKDFRDLRTYQTTDDNLASLSLTSRASTRLEGGLDGLDSFLDTPDWSLLEGFAAALLFALGLLLTIDDGIKRLI